MNSQEQNDNNDLGFDPALYSGSAQYPQEGGGVSPSEAPFGSSWFDDGQPQEQGFDLPAASSATSGQGSWFQSSYQSPWVEPAFGQQYGQLDQGQGVWPYVQAPGLGSPLGSPQSAFMAAPAIPQAYFPAFGETITTDPYGAQRGNVQGVWESQDTQSAPEQAGDMFLDPAFWAMDESSLLGTPVTAVPNMFANPLGIALSQQQSTLMDMLQHSSVPQVQYQAAQQVQPVEQQQRHSVAAALLSSSPVELPVAPSPVASSSAPAIAPPSVRPAAPTPEKPLPPITPRARQKKAAQIQTPTPTPRRFRPAVSSQLGISGLTATASTVPALEPSDLFAPAKSQGSRAGTADVDSGDDDTGSRAAVRRPPSPPPRDPYVMRSQSKIDIVPVGVRGKQGENPGGQARPELAEAINHAVWADAVRDGKKLSQAFIDWTQSQHVDVAARTFPVTMHRVADRDVNGTKVVGRGRDGTGELLAEYKRAGRARLPLEETFRAVFMPSHLELRGHFPPMLHTIVLIIVSMILTHENPGLMWRQAERIVWRVVEILRSSGVRIEHLTWERDIQPVRVLFSECRAWMGRQPPGRIFNGKYGSLPAWIQQLKHFWQYHTNAMDWLLHGFFNGFQPREDLPFGINLEPFWTRSPRVAPLWREDDFDLPVYHQTDFFSRILTGMLMEGIACIIAAANGEDAQEYEGQGHYVNRESDPSERRRQAGRRRPKRRQADRDNGDEEPDDTPSKRRRTTGRRAASAQPQQLPQQQGNSAATIPPASTGPVVAPDLTGIAPSQRDDGDQTAVAKTSIGGTSASLAASAALAEPTAAAALRGELVFPPVPSPFDFDPTEPETVPPAPSDPVTDSARDDSQLQAAEAVSVVGWKRSTAATGTPGLGFFQPVGGVVPGGRPAGAGSMPPPPPPKWKRSIEAGDDGSASEERPSKRRAQESAAQASVLRTGQVSAGTQGSELGRQPSAPPARAIEDDSAASGTAGTAHLPSGGGSVSVPATPEVGSEAHGQKRKRAEDEDKNSGTGEFVATEHPPKRVQTGSGQPAARPSPSPVDLSVVSQAPEEAAGPSTDSFSDAPSASIAAGAVGQGEGLVIDFPLDPALGGPPLEAIDLQASIAGEWGPGDVGQDAGDDWLDELAQNPSANWDAWVFGGSAPVEEQGAGSGIDWEGSFNEFMEEAGWEEPVHYHGTLPVNYPWPEAFDEGQEASGPVTLQTEEVEEELDEAAREERDMVEERDRILRARAERAALEEEEQP